ncbi:hypothetical protein WOLCODRAFT_130856 [Wolfiporia cocos MD-104 SS10]|uniref:Telomere length regulation protein conserved domain-containing protein n=1 Tax=Wolfiporia cocos (strain MD-104) TaxID=742152 RepID=A0A2H3J822_WOLCO|nr:hypothetical protein WOLCODRAFT_130856 [Wolfiporia cocos MD-104 SS10]
MSAEFHDSAIAQIRDTIARLRSPIPAESTLYQLLCAPLACLGLLPPRFRHHADLAIPSDQFSISRHIPLFQSALLEHVIPAWEPVLVREDSYVLVEQYFCPDAISFASPAAGQVAVHAYSTILSSPLTELSIRLLVKLVEAYPIDVLHTVVFRQQSSNTAGKQIVAWEDCVRNLAAIPGKVANAAGPRGDIPSELEQGQYFNRLSVRCDCLISTLSKSHSREHISSLAYLLTKLVNIGIFAPSRPSSPAQPSFFQATLPSIRYRVVTEDTQYLSIWRKILFSLSSSLTIHSIVTSLFSHLTDEPFDLDTDTRVRSLVKREAVLLRQLLGTFKVDDGELLDVFSAVALGREWSEKHARIFACWTASAETDHTDIEGLEAMLARVVDIWANPDHVRHSLLSRHHYLTSLLLLILHSFHPPRDAARPIFERLASSPSFIKSIATYISHLDPAVRDCGLLVAEEVALGTGKKLDFGGWDREDEGKGWCRRLRQLLQERDADADINLALQEDNGVVIEPGPKATNPASGSMAVDGSEQPRKPVVQDSDDDSDNDSLIGYASSLVSSRSPSPTPSELYETEKDPTLNVGKKKIARPVYLAQLGEMVRSTSGLRTEQENMEVEKTEIALDVAEELIRRKSTYGTELEENAVNLTHGFLGLQDNYDIEGFEEKRQAALNALVVCCSRKAAPVLIEEFFRNQYSTTQRYAILNALALGGRELASLPIPPSRVIGPDRLSFPSKRLPPALHKKYITAADQSNANPVQMLLDDISRQAIDNTAESSADKVPELVRERRLRIRQPAKVTEVNSPNAISRLPTQTAPQKMTTFTEVAAEFFICPLINRFWLFLRDEQTREERTKLQPILHQYRGAGTGLVLNAVVLSRLLSTLGVLVHAARNAREWLAIIAPDALELAVTVGTRPVSVAEGEDEEDVGAPGVEAEAKHEQPGGERKEAAVLASALELTLIVLDGCLDLDGGRSLGLEHTALLLGVSEWAEEVLSKLDKGTRVLGEGGAHEIKLGRAAAGVVLKIRELGGKWGRSMINVGSL